ncbi:hypothetical protein IJJ12_02335 [bacterium]|nr:hypothetical protein [bacterium]
MGQRYTSLGRKKAREKNNQLLPKASRHEIIDMSVLLGTQASAYGRDLTRTLLSTLLVTGLLLVIWWMRA